MKRPTGPFSEKEFWCITVKLFTLFLCGCTVSELVLFVLFFRVKKKSCTNNFTNPMTNTIQIPNMSRTAFKFVICEENALFSSNKLILADMESTS